MSNQNPIAGWNSTDDTPVPVRSADGRAVRKAPAVAIGGPGKDIEAPLSRLHSTQSVDTKMMRLSALTGIGCVLVIAVLYFGVGSLKGDVSQSDSTITITTQGTFQPTELSIAPGKELLFINENENPQVIKVKDGRDFIPVQVVFSDPVRVTVPADAAGEYILYSETLADTQQVVIMVGSIENSAAQTSSSSVSSVQSSEEINIPIPSSLSSSQSSVNFVAPVATASSSSAMHRAAPSQAVATAVAPETMEHSTDTVVMSFGGSSSSVQSSVAFTDRGIEPNPYVVGNVGALQQKNAILASKGGKTSTLHSGAPLIQTQRPIRTTDSGPAGTLLALFVIALGVFVGATKNMRAM